MNMFRVSDVRYWRHRLHQARVDAALTLDQAAQLLNVTSARLGDVEYRTGHITLVKIKSWVARINELNAAVKR